MDYRLSPQPPFPWAEPSSIVQEGGLVLFHLKETCTALGIKNIRDALSRLDDDEKDVRIVDTLGGPPANELRHRSPQLEESEALLRGLYKLIFTSRAAKRA